MGSRWTAALIALPAAAAGAVGLWVAVPHRIAVHMRDAVAERGITDATVTADYGVSTLATGRLDALVLEDVHYTIDLADPAPRLPSPITAACDAIATLPADRVELRRASLTLIDGSQRWTVRVDGDVVVRADHARLRATIAPAGGGALSVTARCDRGPDGLRASASLRGRVPALAARGVAGEDLTLDLEAAWHGDELVALTGDANASAVTAHDLTFRDVAGRLRLDGEAIAVEASSVSGLGRVTASARLAANPTWRVDVEAPYVELDGEHPLHQWITAATGARVTGALGYSAHFTARGERIDISLIDATIASDEHGAAIAGVRGDLRLDRLSPPRTPDEQTITWTGATVGEHRLGAGVARFAVGDGGALALRVRLTHLDLATWVPALSRGAFDGAGLADGRVDLAIEREPELHVHVATGELRARGPGVLRARDPAVIARVADDYAAARADGDIAAQAKLRAAGALADFRFTHLRADLYEDPTMPELRVTARGAGVEIPQELDLTVNVTGVEDLLNPLLRDLI